LDIYVELISDQGPDAAGLRIKENVHRVFGVAPRVIVGQNGDIAKSFEGQFKPLRVQDLRG